MTERLERIPFGIHTAEARSGVVSLERVTNLYPEASPKQAKGPIALYPTPGVSLWGTYGDGPIRGMHAMRGDLYVVSGEAIYVIDRSANGTEVGVIPGAGHVAMTDNGTHVAMCGSTVALAVNQSETIQLPESYLNGATYQDGYGIFTQKSTNNLWITGLDDMTTIGGADYTTVDALTGEVVGCISDHREVWVFKTTSSEVYYNSGNATFPFDRAQVIERGCRSGASIAKARNTVFWLGNDLTVYKAAGYQPEPISPPWIEWLIENAADQEAARGFSYEQNGHVFYILCFLDLTLGYDLTTGMWHDRTSEGLGRWRAGQYAKLGGTHLVGDVVNGNVYELSLTTYTDNSDTITRRVTAPPLSVKGNRFTVNELYVDLEMGQGITTGQGSDPQLMLDWSEDAGRTWSNELWAGAGKIGEYTRRATWNRLGQSRQRTFRLTMSDPVNTTILGAFARLKVDA